MNGTDLTPAQLRVMRELASGATYAEVGRRLGVTLQTVKNHGCDARRRLGADTTIEAMNRLGWVKVR